MIGTLAETFFNSVTRKIFTTVGVDPSIEFVDTDFGSPPHEAERPVYRTYQGADDVALLVRQIISDAGLDVTYRSLTEDSIEAARVLGDHLRRVGALRVVDRAEVVDAVFYRGKAAYLVGRIYSGSHVLPLVLALLHPEEGVVLDAVLLTENQVSILFSFARSYFHVDIDRPYDLVRFLRSLMPRKRLVGVVHLDRPPQTREDGVVSGTARSSVLERREVRDRPRHQGPGHDRVHPPRLRRRAQGDQGPISQPQADDAGRGPGAVPTGFPERPGRTPGRRPGIRTPRIRPCDGSPRSLRDLLAAECGRSIATRDRTIVLAHAYIERRVIPLDIYLRDADPALAAAAIVDYGRAIKELAFSGTFPGDLLLKNFGVTRHGRVVFYDYDEITSLARCVFRDIPESADPIEEMAAEPWFAVGPDDVFPEEFSSFLGVEGSLLEAFMEGHSDLLTARWWQDTQRRVAAGEVIDIFPYDDRLRLGHG